MGLLSWLFDAQLVVAGHPILWREIVGNLFGLASAVGGMHRRIWAWPVGIVGNVVLFTVFLGGVFATPQATDLYGQAGRQIVFMAVAVFGWYRWRATQRSGDGDGPAVVPTWAGRSGRLQLVAGAVIGTVGCAALFTALGSYGPWADAWIFTGSVLATYGMAKGWTEFWLVWIAVDIVGVPLLFQAGYYPSAVLYLVYAVVVLYGFTVWVRTQRTATSEQGTAPASTPVLVSAGDADAR